MNNITLQNLSYIAQIISALSILFVVWQIKISLKDIRIRSSREAGLLSMQQAEKFANEILPEIAEIENQFKLKNIILEEKKYFLRSEVLKELKTSENLKSVSNTLKEDNKLYIRIQRLLNRMEALSMIFISGIGDESSVFLSLSKPFCSVVEKFYFMIGLRRYDEETNKSYDNIIKLYTIWSNRRTKNKLNLNIKQLISDAKKIEDNTITPIGL